MEPAHSVVELSRYDSGTTAAGIQDTEGQDYIVPQNPMPDDTELRKDSYFSKNLKKTRERNRGILLLAAIFFRLIAQVLHPFRKLLGAPYEYVQEGDLRVSIFFAEPLEPGDSGWGASYVYVITGLFGCVHLIPSFFLDYPSRVERLLWQIFSGIIMAQPFYALGVNFTLRYGGEHSARGPDRGSRIGYLFEYIRHLFYFLLGTQAVVGPSIYLVARLVLIILACLSLRALSSQAHLSIDWISSFPHFIS